MIKSNIKVNLIIFIVFFSFIWLAEIRPILSDSLNGIVRYSVSASILLIYLFLTKRIVFNKIIILLSLALSIIILFNNIININITLFSVSFLIFPFLFLLFSNNTFFNKKVFNFFMIFHFIILIYSINVYLKIFVYSELSQLNENELATYSLVCSFSVILFSKLYELNKKRIVLFHLIMTMFIAYILESRAILISAIFFLIVIETNRLNTFLKRIIIVFFALIAFFVPILLMEFNVESLFLHKKILEMLNAQEDVINADSSRYEMFELVKETINNNFFGKGIGNTEYLNTISISGLHSGSLDLLYWGGYPLYTMFMGVFLFIILYSYKKHKEYISTILLIYWLILLNYYEGLLFGNMGLTILYIYFTMIYFNVANKINLKLLGDKN